MKQKKVNIVEVLLFIFFIIYPLVFTSSYRDIINVKCMTFLILGTAISFSGCLTLVFNNIDKNDKFRPSLKNVWLNLSFTDFIMIFYLLSNIISVVISTYKIEAFTGSCNNNMGLIYSVIMVFVYFTITRVHISTSKIMIAISLGFSILIVFATLQFMGFDPFYLTNDIPKPERINYLSFIGNTNIFCSYLCLITPIFMMLYIFDERTKYSLYYITNIILGFLGLFISNTDSGYIGYFSAFFITFFVACGQRIRLYKLVKMCLYFFATAILFGVSHNILIGYARPLSNITAFFCKSAFSVIFFIILTFFIIAFKSIVVSDNTFSLIKNGIRIIIFAFIFLCISLIIYGNFIDESVSFGELDNYLKLTVNWGTGRGYVWKWVIEIFNSANIINQLFGFGVGTCGIILLKNYSDIMYYKLGYYYTNAHNEFLETLINCGLLGLVSYIILLVTTVVKGLKSRELLRVSIAIGIIAYGLQSSFVVMQPVVHPLIFIFMAMCNKKSDKNRD